MMLQKRVLVLSFVVLFFLSLVPAFSMLTEDFVAQSWVGRSKDELLSSWGPPSQYLKPSDEKSFWITYSKTDRIWVSGSYANTYVPDYNNPNRSRVTRSYYTPGYWQSINCDVSFTVDAQNTLITQVRHSGSSCDRLLLTPSYISEKGLEDLKNQFSTVDPFQSKSTRKGLRIEKIRKDTAAYQIGIKEGDYLDLQKTTSPQGLQEVVVRRKKGAFSSDYETLTFWVPPSTYSKAYELLDKRQRKLFKVTH
jgi:hypothetical protein